MTALKRAWKEGVPDGRMQFLTISRVKGALLIDVDGTIKESDYLARQGGIAPFDPRADLTISINLSKVFSPLRAGGTS